MATSPTPSASKFFDNLKQEGNHRLSFDIKDVNIGIVNSLRRAIMSDVETVAAHFDTTTGEGDIDFIVNTSVLHNEIIGHRLSLIQVEMNDAQLKHFLPENYRFRIKKRNTTAATISITSGDIEVYDQTGTAVPTKVRDGLFPVDPITKDHIYIVPLHANPDDPQKGEELHVEFRARKGSGSQHARWNPTHHCMYRYAIDPVKLEALIETTAAASPDTPVETIRRRLLALDGQREYFTNADGQPNRFEFSFYNVSGRSCKAIVLAGLEKLKGMVSVFDNDIDEGRCVVTPAVNTNDVWKLTIDKGDITLCNMLQKLLYYLDDDVDFVGYNKPHPHEQQTELNVRYTKPGINIRDALKASLAKIVVMLDEVMEDWRGVARLQESE